ncbi:Indoleamine 2,3-dioxygenase 1 [Fusarium oxysporum f. sp. albedinis]|nr:Indoleamine 2,3-dioxygenase 1 [Fusarium oxysporum f. sp. albedinis]
MSIIFVDDDLIATSPRFIQTTPMRNYYWPSSFVHLTASCFTSLLSCAHKSQQGTFVFAIDTPPSMIHHPTSTDQSNPPALTHTPASQDMLFINYNLQSTFLICSAWDWKRSVGPEQTAQFQNVMIGVHKSCAVHISRRADFDWLNHHLPLIHNSSLNWRFDAFLGVEVSLES